MQGFFLCICACFPSKTSIVLATKKEDAKKVKGFWIAIALLLLLTGCACQTQQEQGAAAPSAQPDAQDAVVLKYYEIGNQDHRVREQVQQAVSAYTEPRIGARVEFVLVSWGDWDSKALTALQAGEQADVFFTADWKGYVRSVTQGLFTPLNDPAGENGDLLVLYGQDIVQGLNPAFLSGTQINGINYAVPTNKELCVPQGYLVNVQAAEEVGMDPEKIRNAWDLEPFLARYKELHPTQYGYLTDKRWSDEPWVESFTAGMNYNLLSMRLAQNADGSYDETVVSVWETEENRSFAELMYRYAQAGYIHPDAALAQYDALTQFNAGEFLVYTAPLKGNGIKAQEMINASGNSNLELAEVVTQPKVVTTTHTGGSMLAIPSGSQNPVLAMKLINLMHADTHLLDLMVYGVEGEMWRLNEENRIELLDSSWYSAHGGAWTMGNTVLQHVTVQEDPEKNRMLQQYSQDAASHPSLGFRYICPVTLESQMAAVNNVAEVYNNALLTGALDSQTALPEYNRRLREAGLDQIREDVQRQYDEWKMRGERAA